jgi:ribosomal protein S18 acetylase RimI-like enzyme
VESAKIGDVEVRRATPDDASAIARVHVRAWRAAYRGILPDDLLDGLSVEQRTARWGEWLAASGGEVATLVATGAGGEVTGFCGVATPSRDDDATERTAEIAATYVDPDRWRGGIGAALLDAALGELRAAGYRDATLWVLAENAPARAFYARHGFAPDGRESRHDATGGQPIVRMRIALTSAAAS